MTEWLLFVVWEVLGGVFAKREKHHGWVSNLDFYKPLRIALRTQSRVIE